MPSQARAFFSKVAARPSSASITAGASSSAASRMAVGTTSLVDCAMLTWSFGSTSAAVAAPAAQQLGGAAGQHLVDVHVVRGAGAGLVDVDHELLAPAPGQHLARRRLDGPGGGAWQQAEPRVGARRRDLDPDGGVDEGRVGGEAGDGEVLARRGPSARPRAPRPAPAARPWCPARRGCAPWTSSPGWPCERLAHRHPGRGLLDHRDLLRPGPVVDHVPDPHLLAGGELGGRAERLAGGVEDLHVGAGLEGHHAGGALDPQLRLGGVVAEHGAGIELGPFGDLGEARAPGTAAGARPAHRMKAPP